MNQGSIDFKEFHRLNVEGELILQYLQYVRSQNPKLEKVLRNAISERGSLITLSIEVADPEDNTRIKHTVRCASNIYQQE